MFEGFRCLIVMALAVNAFALSGSELQKRREDAARAAQRTGASEKKESKKVPASQSQAGVGSKCLGRNCTCRDDFSSAVTFVKHRTELMAQSKEHSWKQLHDLDETHPLKWEQVWYINADENTARNEKMLKQLNRQLERFGIARHRWKATTPDEAGWLHLPTDYAPEGIAQYVVDMTPQRHWETVAVYVSHVDLLKHIHAQDPEGEGLYVILEDDVTLDENWKTEIEQLFRQNQVPKDWDILKFGYWGSTRCQDFVTDKVVEQLPPMMTADGRDSFYSGLLGYVVRPKSIPNILEQLRSAPIVDIDGALMSFGQETEYEDEWGRMGYVSWGAHTYVTYMPLAHSNLEHPWGAGLREKLNMHQRHLVSGDMAPKEM